MLAGELHHCDSVVREQATALVLRDCLGAAGSGDAESRTQGALQGLWIYRPARLRNALHPRSVKPENTRGRVPFREPGLWSTAPREGGGVDGQKPGGLPRYSQGPLEKIGAATRWVRGSESMQPAKLSVCLGFIALCIVTVAMVTAPFSEKRRAEKGFLTRLVDFPSGLGAR